MKLPSDVIFHPELNFLAWRPCGSLDEKRVNQIIRFIGNQEAASPAPFNRFTDLSALDAVDLNFKYVFHVALYRRLTYTGREPVKSAFFVTSPDASHYIKLHAILTDHSPLRVRLFETRESAADWLEVPVDLLQA